MSERVFPSSKPATNGTTANGTAATTTTPAPNPPPAANKAHLYNPTARAPYRPQPRRRRRSGRSICCCCFFWSLLVLLLLILLVAIAGAALYILYRPHRPEFSIPSLRIARLNLTTSSDASSSHVSSLFNFTVISKNPNSHITYAYDPFVISSFSNGDNSVFLGNGTLPAHTLSKKNETSFRNVIVAGSNDLDAESVNALRSDLKKKSNGVVNLKIEFDTKVKVKMDKLQTKKVGIRVTCEGIKGTIPKGKTPTVAVTTKSECKVDLRVKIWKFTF